MTGVFETQTLRVCPTEPIICVKEDLLRKSPNSLQELSLTLILGEIFKMARKSLKTKKQIKKYFVVLDYGVDGIHHNARWDRKSAVSFAKNILL
jgi:hypothetical protein